MIRMFAWGLVFAAAMLPQAAAAQGFAGTNFLPENDLWKEDSLEVAPNVSEDQFNQVIDAALSIYKPVAQSNREMITVNKLWDDSTVNANADRSVMYNAVTINMYGGLARRPEVNAESFALVLCHELGHAYGGAPYIFPTRRLSAEGMADYYGAGECLKKLLPLVPSSFDVASVTGYNAQKCAQNYATDSQDYSVCVRSMEAGLGLGRLLSTIMKNHEPSYLTPDLSIVAATELSYPKTVQCRVDTYHNAIFQLDKPACWFRPPAAIP